MTDRVSTETPDRDVACCDMHNRHCEPPSELCCRKCAEATHDTFPIRHWDGPRCVLAVQPGTDSTEEETRDDRPE